MSVVKVFILVGYAVLVYLAMGMQGSEAAQWAQWLIMGLIVAHVIEVAMFFKKCKAAGGSLPLHMINVLLFGVFHIKELPASNPSAKT